LNAFPPNSQNGFIRNCKISTEESNTIQDNLKEEGGKTLLGIKNLNKAIIY
jgi:hypothetical protein